MQEAQVAIEAAQVATEAATAHVRKKSRASGKATPVEEESKGEVPPREGIKLKKQLLPSMPSVSEHNAPSDKPDDEGRASAQLYGEANARWEQQLRQRDKPPRKKPHAVEEEGAIYGGVETVDEKRKIEESKKKKAQRAEEGSGRRENDNLTKLIEREEGAVVAGGQPCLRQRGPSGIPSIRKQSTPRAREMESSVEMPPKPKINKS